MTDRSQRALLLHGHNLSSNDRNLAALLDFFGVPWSSVTLDEVARDRALPSNLAKGKSCILSSASQMAIALQGVEASNGALPPWIRDVDSVYVYAFQDSLPCQKLLRLLTKEPGANIRNLNGQNAFMSVTSDFPEMCKPMSGIRVQAKLNEGDLVFDLRHPRDGFQSIITADQGTIFCGIMYDGVRFYLNACCNTIDLTRPVAKYFDVKDFFSSAVPPTMYLKWACRDVCWNSAETSACLIVDDPLLKSRYGFLQFREALDLMDKQDFATTIGFIPWNWRRTSPSTVRMFQQRSDRFSISVHGCDHTASEFATPSTALLNTRIKAARHRMELLRQKTSLQCDHVMIFPQGAFSPEAGLALKLNGFVAAVNTEVAPFNDTRNDTRIADVWNVAIMKYGTFPIFTRRYLSHGIENFAFDELLGKPCFIVGHHDTFKDHGRDLVDFIARLHSLKWTLHWRPLGDAIVRTFKIRTECDGTSVIQMYGEKLIIENSSTEPRHALILKEEGDVDCIKAVLANQQPVDCASEGKNIQFNVTLGPKQTMQVQIMYFDKLGMNATHTGVGYDAKTRLRRYLSEFRDNYLSQSELLTHTAGRIRQHLRLSPSRRSK
jgi:hypothetical protein